MKSIQKITILFSMLFLASLISCTSTKKEVSQDGPEYTSAYICPMHCAGSGSAEPGKCPTCGMDYVANNNAEVTIPVESTAHACPMHAEIVGVAGDSCSICHMALEPASNNAESEMHDHDHDHGDGEHGHEH